jgi:hypothetical protein
MMRFNCGKFVTFGLEVQRHRVQERVLNRSHDLFPANDSRPLLVPEGELLRNRGVLIDRRAIDASRAFSTLFVAVRNVCNVRIVPLRLPTRSVFCER